MYVLGSIICCGPSIQMLLLWASIQIPCFAFKQKYSQSLMHWCFKKSLKSLERKRLRVLASKEVQDKLDYWVIYFLIQILGKESPALSQICTMRSCFHSSLIPWIFMWKLFPLLLVILSNLTHVVNFGPAQSISNIKAKFELSCMSKKAPTYGGDQMVGTPHLNSVDIQWEQVLYLLGQSFLPAGVNIILGDGFSYCWFPAPLGWVKIK